MEIYGITLETPDYYGCTVVHYAARAGHLAVLQYCREQGQSMDEADKCQFTPIKYAVMNAHVECLIYLFFECKAQLRNEVMEYLAPYTSSRVFGLEVMQIYKRICEERLDLDHFELLLCDKFLLGCVTA